MNGTETTREAAALHPAARRTDRVRALEALVKAAACGLTDFELAHAIGRQQTSAGKRRGELVALGLVEFAGIHRPAPSGARARVWRVTP